MYFAEQMGQVSRNYWATISSDEKREQARKSALARWNRHRDEQRQASTAESTRALSQANESSSKGMSSTLLGGCYSEASPVAQSLEQQISWSKLQACLERNHTWRAVSSQADTQQSGGRRSRVGKSTKSRLRVGLPGSPAITIDGKAKIRVIENVEKLGFNAKFHWFVE